jgi:hypothetical protein
VDVSGGDVRSLRGEAAPPEPIVGPARAWLGLFMPPVAWLSTLQAGLSLSPMACARGWRWLVPSTALVGVALSAACVAFAWTNWTRLRAAEEQGERGPVKGERFLVGAGLGFAIGVLLVALATLVPAFGLDPCD